MLVREVMTSPAVTVRRSDPPETALQLLARGGYTSLPVVDERGELVGIVSEADLLRASLPPDPRAHLRPVTDTGARPASVAEIMTREPHTTTQSADVAELAQVFARTAWKAMPVLRGTTLVGILSRSDVVRALDRSDAAIADEVNTLFADLAAPTRARVDHGVVAISGALDEREGAAAVALASTVLGVRRVHLAEPEPEPRAVGSTGEHAMGSSS